MSTLREMIDATEGNYGVKIGTKGGSGFLWCGEVAKAKTDMTAIENRVKAKYRTRLKKAKAHLSQMFTECPTVGRYAKTKYRYTGEFGSFEDYLASLPDYFSELEKAKAKIERAEERLANLVPLGDREVIDAYMSISEKDTAIIIVEGNESGDAWDTEEFERLEEQRDAEDREETEEESE